MLKKPAESKHPKEAAPLAHTAHTPSHPVWLSPCGGPENLSGSSHSRLYKIAPGSIQLPAGLLPSSCHRGSCQCIDSYAFASFTQAVLLYEVASISPGK